jgi:hypothetical protein
MPALAKVRLVCRRWSFFTSTAPSHMMALIRKLGELSNTSPAIDAGNWLMAA